MIAIFDGTNLWGHHFVSGKRMATKIMWQHISQSTKLISSEHPCLTKWSITADPSVPVRQHSLSWTILWFHYWWRFHYARSWTLIVQLLQTIHKTIFQIAFLHRIIFLCTISFGEWFVLIRNKLCEVFLFSSFVWVIKINKTNGSVDFPATVFVKICTKLLAWIFSVGIPTK